MTIGKAYAAVGMLAILAVLSIPYENPSGEAIAYAIAIRDGTPGPPNPNHLLVEFTVREIYRLVAPSGTLDPLTFLLWTARLSFVASALLTLRIGSMLFTGPWVPLAVAVGCLSSHGMLWFGTDGHPVLFAHLPLFLGVLLHLRAVKHGTVARHLLAGFAYGSSILVYIDNILPIAAISLASVVAGVRKLSDRTLFTPGVALAVATAGMIVAHDVSGSSLPLHRWVVEYAGGSSNLGYGGISTLSLLRAAFGFGNAFVGTQGAARLIRYWAEGKESILPLPGDGLELFLWVATLAAAGWMTAMAVARLRRLDEFRRAVLAVCLGSALLFVLFNILWIGSHPHFWVPAIPIFWIAWGFPLEGSRRKAFVAMTFAACALLPYNAIGSLRPFRGDTDSQLRRAELMRHTPDDCFVVTGGLDWYDAYGGYFPPGNRVVLSLWALSTHPAYAANFEEYLAAVETKVAEALAAGQRVFVCDVIAEPFPRGVPWREMEPRGFSLTGIQSVLESFPCRPAFTIRGEGYWELSAPQGRAPRSSE